MKFGMERFISGALNNEKEQYQNIFSIYIQVSAIHDVLLMCGVAR